MDKRSFEIIEDGDDWELSLLKDGFEVGGGTFPLYEEAVKFGELFVGK